MENSRYIDNTSDGMILFANNSQNSDIEGDFNNITVGSNILKKRRIIPKAIRN